MAAPIPGADSDRIAALARKYGLMIAIGLDERDGEHLYDSAILVDRTGKLLWKHRKINVLPELMTPPYSEGKAEDIGVVETEYGGSRCWFARIRSAMQTSSASNEESRI